MELVFVGSKVDELMSIAQIFSAYFWWVKKKKLHYADSEDSDDSESSTFS